MQYPSPTPPAHPPSERQQVALIKLLADDDPAIYRAVRKKILSWGPEVRDWLQPHRLSSDPLLRRRAKEIIDHFSLQEADIQFLAFCLRHGEEFDLESCLWLLAATAYPDIRITAYEALLDHYAANLRCRIDVNGPADRLLGAINKYLFDKLGFSGSQETFHDPETSYLNRVMDRRTGNPASLCLVYILLARRLHLPVAGIAFPGYFLCRYQSTSDEVYVDVFNRGKLLTKADCIHHLVQSGHGSPAELLAPLSARRTITRICAALHHSYLQLEQGEQATRLQRYLVALKG
jgi:regulator of sirC expression with transglutaminase-like and TPR domain